MDDRPDTLDARTSADEPPPEAPTTYERDFYLWCFEQAELLRLRRFAQVDLPNVIEELESMGRTDRRALSSSYRLVIAHCSNGSSSRSCGAHRGRSRWCANGSTSRTWRRRARA